MLPHEYLDGLYVLRRQEQAEILESIGRVAQVSIGISETMRIISPSCGRNLDLCWRLLTRRLNG